MHEHPTRDARELEVPLVFFIGLVLFIFLPMMVPTISASNQAQYSATTVFIGVISLAFLTANDRTDHLWVDYVMMVGFHFLYFWPTT